VFGETPDQEWTPEFAQAARAAGVSVLTVEEQPQAGEMVDIVTGIRVPPPQPPSPSQRIEEAQAAQRIAEQNRAAAERLAAAARLAEAERAARAKAKRSQRTKANSKKESE
jgi:hypothetical protein